MEKKRHHYVPKAYLKAFCNADGTIRVYRKNKPAKDLVVTQDHKSPDFRTANWEGEEVWIEVVTRILPIPTTMQRGPAVAGTNGAGAESAAVRFAKTLRSKLQRQYHALPHFAGKPFVIALADFHAPTSMTWSRGALITYLYGMVPKVVERDGIKVATEDPISTLSGTEQIPAEPFRTDVHSELSGVIFSNACTIGKLNRVAVSSGASTGKLRYVRLGYFYDRGALEPISFCMDVASEEYGDLWDVGREPWSAELEVFHNPHAPYPDVGRAAAESDALAAGRR